LSGFALKRLTAVTKGTPSARHALSSFWGSDNSQHVNYIDGSGHVHQLYNGRSAGWIEGDFNAILGGPPALSGSALDGYWGSDGSQHINYVDARGHVQEVYIAGE
jgi:hypothetical protein